MDRLGLLPRWRSKTAAVLLLGLLTSSASARAQGTSADELGRRHFESGVAYLEESDYENALQAFQKAYELSKRPEILLNVATVEERRGNVAGALSALRTYLAAAPDGAHVDTVKLRIQNLEKRGSTQPVEPAVAARPAEAQPAPASQLPAAPGPVPVILPAPVQAAPPPNRIPMFIALGTGAVAAGGAVLTGLLASSEYNDAEANCAPRCTDSDLSTGRTLAVTSTLLTGVAIVGVGVGVVLLVLEPRRESATASRRLELGLRTNAQGGSAEATWRF